MKTMQQLQEEIGQWSRDNFGKQVSKTERPIITDATNTTRAVPLVLGSLNPLMGMMEETGELFGATNMEDKEDAVVDIFVYACDYTYRSGLQMPPETLLQMVFNPSVSAIVYQHSAVMYLGQVFHATLKHHQGIRGMDNIKNYNKHREDHLNMFLSNIYGFYTNLTGEERILPAINETWDNIVSKRDWKKDPAGGGNHDHMDQSGI